MNKYRVGDIAYLIESNHYIREGKLARCSGGIYLFKFIEGGAIQVKEHRLFPSEEAAQAEIDRMNQSTMKRKGEPIWQH